PPPLTNPPFPSSLPAPAKYILTFSLIFFPYSTILPSYLYPEKSLQYLLPLKSLPLYPLVYVIAPYYRPVPTLNTVSPFAH
ncbi:alanine:cation symporter family protein, partial [Bacillus licheniformis]|uniref:alanine:cation symporter family protein n=1 Tax=Bacillus licheniformis TaxID=1402 RepID=UPI0011A27DB7